MVDESLVVMLTGRELKDWNAKDFDSIAQLGLVPPDIRQISKLLECLSVVQRRESRAQEIGGSLVCRPLSSVYIDRKTTTWLYDAHQVAQGCNSMNRAVSRRLGSRLS